MPAERKSHKICVRQGVKPAFGGVCARRVCVCVYAKDNFALNEVL